MRREKLVQRRAAREKTRQAAYEAHQRAKAEQAGWNEILELQGLGMDRGTEGRMGNAVKRGGLPRRHEPDNPLNGALGLSPVEYTKKPPTNERQ